MKRQYDEHELSEALTCSEDEAPRVEDCPDPDRIWAAIECGLSVEERRGIVDHTATCPACAATWQVAREMGARPSRWKVVWNRVLGWFRKVWESTTSFQTLTTVARPAGAVAVLALVVSVGVALRDRSNSTSIPGDAAVYRGREISSSMDGASLDRENRTLRWNVLGADGDEVRYVLRVSDQAIKTIILSRELEDAEYQLTEEELAEAKRIGNILWKITAIFPDGTEVSSKAFDASVR